jgi:hypothetical protein
LLQSELRYRNDLWVADAAIRYLQDQLAKRDLALEWMVNSRLLVWAKEDKVRARVEELSLAMDNLQVYYNTLHEEVHVLYSPLHPNIPVDLVGMEVGLSRVAREALDGALDLFRPPPSLKLVDKWSPTPNSKATKSKKKVAYQVPLTLARQDFPANMVVLKGQYIDVILGMNWLAHIKQFSTLIREPSG